MRPPEAQRRSAAARARPKTPSIDSERRAAIAKSQVVSRTLVAGAYFEVSNRLKNSRRVATRCDHTATSFLGFAMLASIRQRISFVHAA